ncbi:PR domain zinc finger protein 5-like isoform X1 [Maniola jurtina]|uniref:PR domain zinc finger protein 5-like isoform X1 n=1 Tax=Maniola jurtina TaxID=191418 RepID=UPI001E6886FA|nr:PR domain zinc finger protein 5-like isoform X1 [Maniola jurtina]
MAAKTSDWRPGPTVCRCCLSEGCYKDISTEYFWMGKREVYSEMLSETFDLSISYSKSGGPNSQSRLICEPCIARLRDAADFKRQVQECEKTFMSCLDPVAALSDLQAVLEMDKEVKVEMVMKEEKRHSDDDFDDVPDFGDDDDYDDLDDQPLTKLATKIPKKETVDVLDLLDNAKITAKRKSSSKLKTHPSKKSKSKQIATSSKEKPEPKKKKGPRTDSDGLKDKERKQKMRLFERSVMQNPLRQNAVLVLRYSTAIPFKTRFNRILCSYCYIEFETIETLRDHVKAKHAKVDYNSAFYKVVDDLKIDISYFKCNLCMHDVDSVETFMTHLLREHNKAVNFEVPFGVLPYRQNEAGEWLCLYCKKKFQGFSEINGHLRSHATLFTCDNCSATFLSEHGLKQHERKFKCYSSGYKPRYGMALRQRRNTEMILQCSTAWPFRTWGQNFNCVLCRVQSNDPNGLRAHMACHHLNYDIKLAFSRKLRREFLKVDITDLKCKLCFIHINSLEDLLSHLKDYHKQPIDNDVELAGVLPFKLNDGSDWNCAICKTKFSDFLSLKKHTVEHFQKYVCDTCGEGFITEAALKAHVKIPHDNKYNCRRCKATFLTLEERNIHMKTQHTSLPYMCTYCKEKPLPRFATWELRRRHLMEMHNLRPGAEMYECTTCHMMFKSRSQKYHHNVKVHRTKKDTEFGFSCEHCARGFATKLSLDKHVAKKHFHV